ncbi:MAG: type II secretion system protein GspL [Oceanicaulis sp.]
MAFDEEMHFAAGTSGAPASQGAGEPALRWAPGGVALAPAPGARLLVLHLPMKTAAARAKGAGYAAEPQLSEPLDAVHVAVGPALGEDRYLCAAASHADMAAWIAELDASTEPAPDLVPELCTLGVPEPGAWTVCEHADRVRVRTPDGAGLVCSRDVCDQLAGAQGVERVAADLIDGAEALYRPVSLRTGAYARRSPAPRTAARFLGLLAGITAGLAFTLLLVEIAGLSAVRDARVEEARTRVETLYGARAAGALIADPVPALTRLAPGAVETPALEGLMAAAGAALAARDGAVSLLALEFRGSALTLSLEAGDLSGLQAVQADLRAAGLALDPGPVSQTGGRAEMSLTIRSGGAP